MVEKKISESNGSGLKIKHKILLTMIIVSLIPLGGLWYISIYKTKQNATAYVYQTLFSAVSSLVDKVDDWNTMNLLILEQNSQLADIQSMEAKRQDSVLKTISANYKWIYLAFTVLPSGQNVGRSDGQPTQQYGDREYFQQIMNGRLVGQQVTIGKTSGKPALITAVPVYNANNDRSGIIAFAMTLEDLSKSITNISLGKTGYAILLDDKTRVVARGKELSTELQDLKSDPIIDAAVKAGDKPFVFEEKGKQILAYSRNTKNGWKLIVRQDYDEAFASTRQTQQHAVLLLTATATAVILLAIFLASGIAGPIRRLTEVADNMSRGELNVEIKETKRRDELGALARAIERMGISLQMAFKRMKK